MPKYAVQTKEELRMPQETSRVSGSCIPGPIAANDSQLHEELEQRYGAAFAQWIMDDLRRASVI